MKLRSNLGPVVFASVIVLCVGQVAVAQVDWTFDMLCVGPGPPGSWDPGGHAMGDVVFDGTLYHMYLVGGVGSSPLSSSWSVGHWISTDKLSWFQDPDNPVLEPEPGEWDGYSIYGIAVMYDGSMFHLWYGSPAYYREPVYVGYATNDDGWGPWTKHADNPVDGLEPGAPGELDDRGVTPSTVFFNGTDYEMWYNASCSVGHYWGTWRLGYATSVDGLSWTKHDTLVLVGSEPWEGAHLWSPEVVPYGSGFAMWYTGHDLVTGRTGYAISQNGIDWGQLNSNAVILEGDTAHGWVSHCADIYYVTSPLELVFFDDLETGGTSIWSTVVP